MRGGGDERGVPGPEEVEEEGERSDGDEESRAAGRKLVAVELRGDWMILGHRCCRKKESERNLAAMERGVREREWGKES